MSGAYRYVYNLLLINLRSLSVCFFSFTQQPLIYYCTEERLVIFQRKYSTHVMSHVHIGW